VSRNRRPSGTAPSLREVRPALPALGALLLAIAAPPAAAAAGPPSDAPDPEWRAGPIRLILTVKEDAEYRKLRTPEGRRDFIERFWAALDPTPGTEINERRLEFWHRVERAGELFNEAPLPGWKTARGKAYILMGPPDERAPRGPAELWIYRALPGPDAPPEIRLNFRRNLDGQYRMQRDDIKYLDYRGEPGGDPVGETFLAVRGAGGRPQILRERIRMTEFPRAAVRTLEFVGAIDFIPRYDFYKAEDGTSRALLTLAVPAGQFGGRHGRIQEPDLALSVTVQDLERGKVVRQFSETLPPVPGRPEAASRSILFQSWFSLPPGDYQVALTLSDRRSGRGVSLPGPLAVPDFERGLSLSTLLVGRQPEGAGETPGPFAQGRIAAVPDPERLFAAGETLTIAYQVYNARHRREAADLDVEYRFFLNTESGPRQAGMEVVLTHQQGESLAYSLPLAGWPEGDYLVKVRVTDNLSRATATREERFRVVERSPGGAAVPEPAAGLSPGAEAIIWLGRRTAYLGRYREAVAIYSRRIQAHPDDPRLYRHRGHRYITLRRFDLAIADLEKAARLVEGKPDAVEPDGLPNARGVPTSTLDSNIWYHLGLARYLSGDLEGASRAYRECMRFSGNPDQLVATTHWLYMTLRRLRREEEAGRILEPIRPGMDIIENGSYHRLCLMYRGEVEPGSLLEAAEAGGGALEFATLGYGVGNWHLDNGRADEAARIFRAIREKSDWAAFGHIAAEAELRRLGS
jgi:GWxTD domain-containing protein